MLLHRHGDSTMGMPLAYTLRRRTRFARDAAALPARSDLQNAIRTAVSPLESAFLRQKKLVSAQCARNTFHYLQARLPAWPWMYPRAWSSQGPWPRRIPPKLRVAGRQESGRSALKQTNRRRRRDRKFQIFAILRWKESSIVSSTPTPIILRAFWLCRKVVATTWNGKSFTTLAIIAESLSGKGRVMLVIRELRSQRRREVFSFPASHPRVARCGDSPPASCLAPSDFHSEAVIQIVRKRSCRDAARLARFTALPRRRGKRAENSPV